MSADDKDQKKSAGEPALGGKPKTSPARAKKAPAAFDYRIPEGSRWAGLWKISAGVGAVGLVLAGVGYATDPTRFAFSYLFAFICALTVALGSLFFIIIERLTSAGWSVAVRRIAEFFASGFPALVVLFVPVLLSMGILFPWLHEGHSESSEAAEHHETSLLDPLITSAHAEERDPAASPPRPPPGASPTSPTQGRPPGRAPGAPPAANGASNGHPTRPDVAPSRGHAAREGEALEAREEETLAKKAGYLNRNFFLVRVVLYFSAWLFVAFRYFRLSTSQDASKDPAFTRQAQGFAPVATILFGLSLTFAAFDWIMSLDPTWFSTIFGVTFFAGCVVTIFATLTVVAMALREDGLIRDAITIEHFHDLGKLLFGFLVFWAYVNFSQFMLIWYAALPEETGFYHHRWDVGPWAYVSLLIVIAHFIVPFFLLLSRNVKRRLPALRIGAVWLLVMHVVEIYWLVMPNYNHGESTVSWIDLACLFGVLGIYLAVVFRNMTRYPLIPVGDPRLTRSLTFENV
jgi:hypothetical protein